MYNSEQAGMTMDINRYLVSFFGKETVGRYLMMDGGTDLWNLYFRTAESRDMQFNQFIKSVLEEEKDQFHFISSLDLLPCCKYDIKKTVMTDQEADAVLQLADAAIESEQYRRLIMFLNEFRLPTDYVNRIIERTISAEQFQQEELSIYNSKKACRDNLCRIFPSQRDMIYDHTVFAVNAFEGIMDSKASTLNDFITHYRNGFTTETSLYGLQLNSSLVRAYSSNREESCSEEMKDLLEDLEESFDQCFPNEDFKDDPVSFWSMITDYFPGNEANGEMFRNEVSYCLCSKETEGLWFVEDFMENLSFDYKLNSDKVMNTYLIKKPLLNRKLLKEFSDEQRNKDGLFESTDLLVKREDIMLLFMTMYPAAEDERVMMPEDVIEELIRYTEFEITYLSLLELIMLIHYSEKYRLPDEINMKWTKQYFKALSDRMDKGGNSWLN